MKGYFSLQYNYHTEELSFGKLENDTGILGPLDSINNKNSNMATLIAHDVVEHSSTHRTSKFVSWEVEIRALGAVSFVREGEQFNLWSEISNMCENLQRDIEPVPYIVGKFLLKNYYVEADFMRTLIQNGISPKNARNIVYQYAWGKRQKELQFDGQYWQALDAFKFVENNVTRMIKEIINEEFWFTGISCFFDIDKSIFRYQMKRQ